MIQLYEYQKEYIGSLRDSIKRGNRRVVLCAPTGAGKTIMFTYMISSHLKKGGRVLVFTHRKELLKQAGGSFEKFGITPEYIQSGKQPDLTKPVHVAMIETFNRRKDEYSLLIKNKTLVIIDEAHLQNFNKVLPLIPPSTIVIGATATPERKGKDVQMSDFYTDIVQIMDTPDVIELGKLNPAKSYGVQIDLSGAKRTANDYDTEKYYTENKLFEGVVNNWEKHAPQSKTILFASSVKSSMEVAQEFYSRGYEARHIDGKMSEAKRNETLEWFANSPNGVLCNCGILTAGYDQPDIETVILYRATTSLPLFLQMCGRGSRLFPGKNHFKILDFGNNIQRLGFWENRRIWKLDNSTKNKKEQPAPVKICPKCDAILRASETKCDYCGFVFPKKKKTKEEVELIELENVKAQGKKLSNLSIQSLITLQKTKELKAPFVWRVIRSRGEGEILYYAKLMGYKQEWVRRQKEEIRKMNYEFNDYVVK